MTQEQALSILKTGTNAFLTGEPGSGKTHTVNRYISYLRKHKIEPAITASTGIAATHIGGMTIHSWSGIGIKREFSSKDLHNLCNNERISKRISKTKVLLIDEISMFDAKTFSMVDLVCRKVRKNNDPFGGIQVILVGDFFQLPPVTRGGESIQFAFESESWIALNPINCYLTEQHRQEDQKFLSLLGAIRKNNIEETHIDYLNNQIGQHYNLTGITKLYSHNANVDQVNNNELNRLSGNIHSFEMNSGGRKALVQTLKNGCLSPEKLLLKEGATVMFTKNNPREGFVNGTLGIVVKFDKQSGYPIVKTQTGKHIKAVPMEWTIQENEKALARIEQIPLRLAWAITIHKSQGMSLDAAVIDLRMVFEFGQGYVALSRVRHLQGLFLLGYNKQSLLVHPEILKKDKEFKSQSVETKTYYNNFTKKEKIKKYHSFIIKCEGKIKESQISRKKLDKGDTYSKTLILFKGGKKISEITKERGLVFGTILSHIEKLVERKDLNSKEIEYLVSPKLAESLPIIHATFKELKTEKLSSVFEKFNGKYSYMDLRIARMFLKARSHFH